ncbi:hypothetical protein LguiB_012431 [Lonicera macranthoides]
MVVASIAHYDWPEDWSDLLLVLIKLINDPMNGALRCLALLSADLDDTVVPKIVPVLFPCLHTIISSPRVNFASSSCSFLPPPRGISFQATIIIFAYDRKRIPELLTIKDSFC